MAIGVNTMSKLRDTSYLDAAAKDIEKKGKNGKWTRGTSSCLDMLRDIEFAAGFDAGQKQTRQRRDLYLSQKEIQRMTMADLLWDSVREIDENLANPVWDWKDDPTFERIMTLRNAMDAIRRELDTPPPEFVDPTKRGFTVTKETKVFSITAYLETWSELEPMKE